MKTHIIDNFLSNILVFVYDYLSYYQSVVYVFSPAKCLALIFLIIKQVCLLEQQVKKLPRDRGRGVKGVGGFQIEF